MSWLAFYPKKEVYIANRVHSFLFSIDIDMYYRYTYICIICSDTENTHGPVLYLLVGQCVSAQREMSM